MLAVVAMGAAWADQGFPRIANLWGFGPQAQATEYAKLARYGMLVMSGGSAEAWRSFSKEMRSRNPEIRLIGTAPLMNLTLEDSASWMKDEWYLRRPDGKKVVWWGDQIVTPNLLNDDCLAALVARTDKLYGDALREGTCDGLFYDSVVGSVTWLGDVDTNLDGVADKPEDINPKWHARQNLFFQRLHEKFPKMVILANDTDEGHTPVINGRLFEGGPVLDRVAEGSMGIKEAISTLDMWMTKSLKPPITFALASHPLGWQGWRVPNGPSVSTKAGLPADEARSLHGAHDRCLLRLRLRDRLVWPALLVCRVRRKAGQGSRPGAGDRPRHGDHCLRLEGRAGRERLRLRGRREGDAARP